LSLFVALSVADETSGPSGAVQVSSRHQLQPVRYLLPCTGVPVADDDGVLPSTNKTRGSDIHSAVESCCDHNLCCPSRNGDMTFRQAVDREGEVPNHPTYSRVSSTPLFPLSPRPQQTVPPRGHMQPRDGVCPPSPCPPSGHHAPTAAHVHSPPHPPGARSGTGARNELLTRTSSRRKPQSERSRAGIHYRKQQLASDNPGPLDSPGTLVHGQQQRPHPSQTPAPPTACTRYGPWLAAAAAGA